MQRETGAYIDSSIVGETTLKSKQNKLWIMKAVVMLTQQSEMEVFISTLQSKTRRLIMFYKVYFIDCFLFFDR